MTIIVFVFFLLKFTLGRHTTCQLNPKFLLFEKLQKIHFTDDWRGIQINRKLRLFIKILVIGWGRHFKSGSDFCTWSAYLLLSSRKFPERLLVLLECLCSQKHYLNICEWFHGFKLSFMTDVTTKWGYFYAVYFWQVDANIEFITLKFNDATHKVKRFISLLWTYLTFSPKCLSTILKTLNSQTGFYSFKELTIFPTRKTRHNYFL